MSIQLEYPVTYNPENALSYGRRRAVPLRRECPSLPPGYLLNEGDSWNCNLCGGDSPFFAPFMRGDFLPFQFNFPDLFNLDPSVLLAGFRESTTTSHYIEIDILDETGATVFSSIDSFCSVWWVAYDEAAGSLQTFVINTALFPNDLKCFQIKVTILKRDPDTLVTDIERVLFSEFYQELEVDCFDTELIESSYAVKDCFNLYYTTFDNFLGNKNDAYYNSVRVFGEIEYLGDAEQREETDRRVVTKKEILESYRLTVGIVPPYFARRVATAIRGERVSIGGQVYEDFGETDKANDDTREFFLELTFSKTCEIDNRLCNFG